MMYGKKMPFKAKETKKEERAERKFAGSKAAYEKMERRHEKKKSTSKMK